MSLRYLRLELFNKIIAIFAVAIVFYTYNRMSLDKIPEQDQLAFSLKKLELDPPNSLLFWDIPIDHQSVLKRHVVKKNDSIECILQQYKLKLSSKLSQVLNNPATRAAKIMRQIQPHEHLYFFVQGQTVSHFVVQASNEEYYIQANGVMTLTERMASQTELSYRRIDVTMQKGIYADLSAIRVPTKVIQLLTEVLSQRLNLKKEIKEGDQIILLYSVNPQNQVILHKFSLVQSQKVITGYYFPHQGYNFAYPEGLSFKRSFLERPVEPSIITSVFSNARYHPVLGVVRAHRGVDFAAPKGTPVHATSDGKVNFIGVKGGYGNVIEIEHPQSIKTVYAHLDGFSQNMLKGRAVAQGQIIGYVGMTGLATGPHLHYEYKINDVAVDPLAVSFPKKSLFKGNELALFRQKMKEIDELEQLNS